MIVRHFLVFLGFLGILSGCDELAAPPPSNDVAGQGIQSIVHEYPTTVRAEYVFACMAANQMTQNFLYRCSCAIDTIAKRLSYEDYERAETLSRLYLGHSPREQAYRSVGMSKELLDRFFRAQAASELACF